MIRSAFSIITVFISLSVANGQAEWNTLRGNVIDAVTRQKLPFASIQVHRKNTGTLSNADADFLFKINKDQSADTIEVSYVGYRTALIPVRAFTEEVKSIELNPATEILDEVIIRARSGEDIIKEFITRIAENYDTIGQRMQAFYREGIVLEQDTISFSEAVVAVVKGPYTKPAKTDQMSILKGRQKKVDWKSDPLYGWMSGLANGAGLSLREDMVRNYATSNSPLNPSNFRYYKYGVDQIVDEGNKSLYVVSFAAKPKTPRSKVTLKGVFYFNASSFALERIVWTADDRGISYLNRHRGLGYKIAVAAYQTTVAFTAASEVISWSELNGQWHLQQVRRELSASVNSGKRKMKNARWKATSMLAVTAVTAGDTTRMDEKENVINNMSSVRNLMKGKDSDVSFWENYNIVQPTYVDTIFAKAAPKDSVQRSRRVSNRQNGFTRADSLQGALSPMRSCYDVKFYHLDIKVDPAAKTIEGSSTIRFTAVQPFSKMQIDLFANIRIDHIAWHGKTLNYQREFNAVYVEMPVTLREGGQDEIKVFYSGTPKTPDFSIPMNGGFLWETDVAGKPWAQVVCQGSGASLWWPCKDHLSDEPDSARITVTVPSGLTEISNGRLRSKTDLPGNQTRYDWYVSYPINNYNITVNLGDYLHRTDTLAGGTPLTLDYYYKKESQQKAELIFNRVKPMLHFYQEYFGPYPFPRDGFTLMESLYPMEHQSAVSIGKFIGDRMDTVEMEEITRLLHHEVAHEWWGNSVSVSDYADFWLHEAFATYAEALLIEKKYGYEAAADYLYMPAIKNREPIIGVRNVNHIFYDLSDLYNKGALVLNTLRHVIQNDSLWFGILRGIQRDFKYKTVTSAEIERYISISAHQDLQYFFDQYLRTTRVPKLVYELSENGTSTVVRYRWENTSAGFHMPVRATLHKKSYGMIYPETTWKTMTIKDFGVGDFDVKEDEFYIQVESK